MNGINKKFLLTIFLLISCQDVSPKINSRFNFINASQEIIQVEFNRDGKVLELSPNESYKYVETIG